ncbi:MAG: GTPase ObgE [Chloroflexi bacterium]|nr:GTPase ObgE [Chloroflexota bacterium]
MIDQVDIHVASGKGGNGIVSGRREKFVPRGGPDGGDGGDGGSLRITCDPNVNTLLAYRYKRHFSAGNGGNGAGALKHGKNGEDVDLIVPIGTQVWDSVESTHIADLATSGQSVVVAQGGKGGKGNARFATSTNQYPLLAEEGEPGEEVSLRLELKLLADVGIIGLPNAGKSSLLAAVSAARPKIAAYPFTTLEPVLGVVGQQDESFVMVDIPGLIEGAHEGIGLGHDFLRHVERTRVLIHMVDGSTDSPVEDYEQINEELRLYNEDLMSKPQIIVINKIDIPEVQEALSDLKSLFAGMGTDVPVYCVSAVGRLGLDALLNKVLEVLDETKAQQQAVFVAPEDAVTVIRPRPRKERMKVHREDDTYIVTAPRAARIAALLDDSDWNARIQFHGYLQRAGIVRALEEAGIGPGDTVRFGDTEWEWE